jgi:peptidyl-prolyl cis-trans isomerase C
MKCLTLLALFVLAAPAQTNPAASTAQASPWADLAPNTVVATFDGKKLTAGDLQKMLAVLPPQNQQAAARDPRAFVQQYAMMLKLSEMAEKNKLDQESPAREALAYNRSYILSNAQLSKIAQDVEIPAGAHEKYYEANKDRYQQVRVKAIYLPFSSTPITGAKHTPEGEARALAEKLIAKLRAGADFVALVKEYSRDSASKLKDGDFPIIRKSDNIPEAIRSVVFSLKKGEISDPVRQPNGFYIFRAEEVAARPLSEVKGEIDSDLRDRKAREVLDGIVKSLGIQFTENVPPAAPAAASTR